MYMSATNLTPLDILKRRKIRLLVKAEALTDILEENMMYLQDNAVPLVSESAMDTITSKMPPFIQSLLGKGHKISLSDAVPQAKYSTWIFTLLDFVPMFLKGGKGFIATLLIKQIKKLFSK